MIPIKSSCSPSVPPSVLDVVTVVDVDLHYCFTKVLDTSCVSRSSEVGHYLYPLGGDRGIAFPLSASMLLTFIAHLAALVIVFLSPQLVFPFFCIEVSLGPRKNPQI